MKCGAFLAPQPSPAASATTSGAGARFVANPQLTIQDLEVEFTIAK